MSANGSMPAPGRNLTYFAWRVTSAPDGRVVASVTGYAGQLALPTGRYTAALAVYDNIGANGTTSLDFVIGGVSSSTGTSAYVNGTPVAAAAVISLPPPHVAQAAGSGLTRVVLDCGGSAPAAGARIANVLWAIVALPLRTAAANATGAVAAVWLPPGSYQARVPAQRDVVHSAATCTMV